MYALKTHNYGNMKTTKIGIIKWDKYVKRKNENLQ